MAFREYLDLEKNLMKTEILVYKIYMEYQVIMLIFLFVYDQSKVKNYKMNNDNFLHQTEN